MRPQPSRRPLAAPCSLDLHDLPTALPTLFPRSLVSSMPSASMSALATAPVEAGLGSPPAVDWYASYSRDAIGEGQMSPEHSTPDSPLLPLAASTVT